MPGESIDDAVDQQGARLKTLLASLRQAGSRIDALEKSLTGLSRDRQHEPREPLPEAVAGAQALLDDQDFRTAHLRQAFVADLERGVDALEGRLDWFVETIAHRRRHNLRVLPRDTAASA
jgi:hypothetical protein